MTKLTKYLKSSAGLVVAIVALLFLQAHCDLTLPEYTSKIVNEGIQQKGIEDGVPEKMSAGTKRRRDAAAGRSLGFGCSEAASAGDPHGDAAEA